MSTMTVEQSGDTPVAPTGYEGHLGRSSVETKLDYRPPTDIELVIAAVEQRKRPNGPYGQILSEIGNLRARMDLVTTVIAARWDPEVSPFKNPEYREDYVSHQEVYSKLQELNIDFRSADIQSDDHDLIHRAYESAAARGDRIRYSPDNKAFQEWVVKNYGENSSEHNYMRFLAANDHLAEDDLTKNQLEKDHNNPNYQLFIDLYSKWSRSPDWISDSSVVPDAFNHMGLSAGDSAHLDELKNLRAELAIETRYLLYQVIPELKRAITETEKIELILTEDSEIVDIPNALIKRSIEQSATPLSEESLRPGTIAEISSVEAAHAYLRLVREYLRQIETGALPSSNYGRTALRLVA